MKNIFVIFFFLAACASETKKNRVSYNQVSLPAEKSRSQYDATSSQFMVSTQGTHSTQAGIEVLKKGGNLFDAFTAISFAIGVERPHSTGIGGGGFVIFYSAREKKVYAFDFRETAPKKANEKMFLNSDGVLEPAKSLTGGLSIATPGHVAGVLEIQKKFGNLKLNQVLAPAIRMAANGIPVYSALHDAITEKKQILANFPSSKKIFLNKEGNPWPVGHLLKQKDLAQSLRLIAKKGPAEFYEGSIAKKIVQSISKNKGVLDLSDLKNYRALWREPLKTTYRNSKTQYEVYSQPLPSAGGTQLVQILNTLENAQLRKSGPQSARSIHLTASAMQQSFYDRSAYMGDPDFVKVPVEKLTSKAYGEKIRISINEKAAKHENDIITKEESPETTHFSLVDSEGNMIASTQTINGFFGSGLVADGTGIMLNNEMDDFATQVGASNLYGAIGGAENLITPLKRPLSSMAPTLVLKDGEPFMALGTPSGTRIISCVALTLLNVLEYDLPLWDAITLTRYHHQWKKDALQIENPGLPPDTLLSLQKKGYDTFEKNLGCRVQVVQKRQVILQGVSDPREEGFSQGL